MCRRRSRPARGLPVLRYPCASCRLVTIGGVAASLQYLGIPVGPWKLQVNFTVPPNAPLGVQSVVVTVGSASSPAAATFTVCSSISSQVLDEQHLIAALVVNQLIHQVAGHEDAETARALSRWCEPRRAG